MLEAVNVHVGERMFVEVASAFTFGTKAAACFPLSEEAIKEEFSLLLVSMTKEGRNF